MSATTKLRCWLCKCSGEVEVVQVVEYELLHAETAKLHSRIQELEDGLREIAKAEGAYSMDLLMHAGNTIDNMQRIAVALLEPRDVE